MIVPPKLKPGDKIGLMSPSKALLPEWREWFENAIEEVESKLGLEVVVGKNVWNQNNYMAGTVEERISDLHSLVEDPEIKAIIFTIGGRSANQMLEHIDFDLIKSNPKIYAGLSDPTALLNPITSKAELITYYGVEFIMVWGRKGISNFELENVKAMWFENHDNYILPKNSNWESLKQLDVPEIYTKWESIRPGSSEGHLIGGSGGFVNLLNTDFEPNLSGRILFMELYDRKDSEIDRIYYSLRHKKVFDKINGLIIGYNCNHLETDNSLNRPISEIALDATRGYDFPILYVPDIGHYVRNPLLPIGAKTKIDSDKMQIEFSNI